MRKRVLREIRLRDIKMRSVHWDEARLSSHRASIADPAARSAFDTLVLCADAHPTLAFEASMKGEIRVLQFHTLDTGQQPYSCIVNRNSLLFYIRRPGIPLLQHGREGLLQALPQSAENRSSELTIRLSTPEDVTRAFAYIFGAEDKTSTLLLPLLASTSFEPLPRPSTQPANSQAFYSRTANIMNTIEVPAALVRQGDLTLFTTSIKVRDLIVPGFYSVETLDPENASDRGYQRLLNTARAKRLADYVVEGQDSRDAFLPTSVFLATDKAIPYDTVRHCITIDSNAVGPFSVVDGQHRLEGLRIAASKDPRVLDFDVPVNIAENLPKIAQMCHFLIVNTTQKSVDAGVEQRIIARLTSSIDLEDIPSLPKWIRKRVELGDEEQAVRLVDYLNQTEDSPWKGKVALANADRDGATINQKSFVKAIVKYVLTANNPLVAMRDFDREKKIFFNYWKAIEDLLDDGKAAVLYKYNGVELFCKFSMPFFMKCQNQKSFSVATQTALLRSCFDALEGDYAGLGHPEWWASGSKASFLNAGAINQAAGALGAALNRGSMADNIEI